MCAADCERQECHVNLATSESVLLYHTGRTSTRGAGRTIGRSGGATRFFLHDQQIGAERRPADVGCHHAVRVAQPAPHRQLRKSAETSRRLGRCRSGIGAVAGWRRRWVQQLKSLAKSTKVSFWIKCTRLYPAGPSLPKVPKCLSTNDGTFDLICIRFFRLSHPSTPTLSPFPAPRVRWLAPVITWSDLTPMGVRPMPVVPKGKVMK